MVDFCGIYLADPWRLILAEIERVLVAGGELLLEQPLNPLLSGRSPTRRHSLIGGFDSEELLDAVEAGAMQVVGTERIGPFGLDLVARAVRS